MELRDQVIESTYYIREHSGGDRFCENWEARSIFSTTPLLCKVLRQPIQKYDGTRLRQFTERIRELIGVSHDGVERTIASGTYNDHTYFIVESLSAQTIDAFMNDPGAVAVEESLHIGIRIARALTYMHVQGITHGHLHPGLIRVQTNYDGICVLKICEYYLSAYERLAGSRLPDLSPEPFMAPEKEGDSGNRPGGGFARDVYSFGILLHWLFTGVVFHNPQPGEQTRISLSAQNPRVPPALDSIVASCLGIAPERQIPDMEGVLNDLIHVSIDFQKYFAEPEQVIVPTRKAALVVFEDTPEKNSAAPAEVPAGKKHGEKTRRKKAARSSDVSPARSSGDTISALDALHPHFPDMEREILYFKQLFYDLYIPRGSLYLVDTSRHLAVTEKRRWLSYFEDFVSYSRGAVLTIAGGEKANSGDLLYGLTGAVLQFWLSLRQEARREFSSGFGSHFSSRYAFLATLNPDIPSLFDISGAQKTAQAVSSPGSEEHAAVFEQIIRFTVDRYRPLLLVLNKVQALTPRSLRLLEGSVHLVSDLPVLIIGFTR